MPRVLHVVAAVVVLAVLAAAGTAYWLGRDDARAPRDDRPAGLDLPAAGTPPPVAPTPPADADDALEAAAVRRALAPQLADRDLGRHVVVAVAGADGRAVLTSGRGPAVPASTLKLLTSAAALETLGPDHRFATKVVAGGRGRVVLVGGGDPLLASKRPDAGASPERADVVTLARATARALRAEGRTSVRVGYDTGMFAGPAVSPDWPKSYIPEAVVAPIQALWVDEGRPAEGTGRVADPAAAAAARFAEALAGTGIRVVGSPARTTAPGAAAELARVESAPLAQIVQHTLEYSDNEAAEVLARHVALATGAPASFAGGAEAVRSVVGQLGVPLAGARTYDGSGLSRRNRLDPATLTGLLAVAGQDDRPQLRPVLTGLPVARFTGSLARRFDDASGGGWVRAKTGTLTGVSGLAGTVADADGAPMVFAVLADRIKPADTLDAQATLDDLTSALAACHCG